MNPGRSLSIQAGPDALALIRDEGLRPERVRIVPAASGGPKWLVLSALDRYLFGTFLAGRTNRLEAIGSSIGSWRLACAAQPDPVAAIDRFEHAYVHEQHYPKHPSPATVSRVSRGLLETLLGDDGACLAVHNSRIGLHVITTRIRGLSAGASILSQYGLLGTAGFLNLFGRPLLGRLLERVVFHSGDSEPFGAMVDLPTAHAPLTGANMRAALMASGSIPGVLEPVIDVPDAPTGIYVDGGTTDYHLDLPFPALDGGIVLYPHFFPYLIPGWFDKPLRWRRTAGKSLRDLVLISPSRDWVASLPFAKIPDRHDFSRLSDKERIGYWTRVVAANRRLADEFSELVESGRIRSTVTPISGT